MNRLFLLGSLLILVVVSGCLQPAKRNSIATLDPPPTGNAGPDLRAGEPRPAAPSEDAVRTAAAAFRRDTEPDGTPRVAPPAAAGEPVRPETVERGDASGIPGLDEALDFCQVSQDFWQKGELENALEALDQAYALILNVDTHNKPKLIQEKEDLRFLISKRILEIYASRNIVVNGYHDAIPLDLNRHVQAEIDNFTRSDREKGFFQRAYRRSGRYRSQIVKALKQAGLPEELSWLPLIESGYVPNALSRARALGLWQFISSTGYKFGLKRTTYVDERLDPVKSTRAAIAYLSELHQIFGDWTTVLAAYNCGEGRVLRVIRSQNVNYLDNFWDLYEKLPRETARYVPRFLATLHVLKNPSKYGLDDIEVDEPMDYETVTVSKRIHLREAARASGISESELKDLNPELRRNVVPGEDYPLRVPPDCGEKLLAGLEKMPEHRELYSGTHGTYRVRSGDTLSSIARRHGTSVASIMRANNLKRSNYIVVGSRLKIPGRAAVQASASSQPADLQSATHVVRRGDSLWIIARRYGTTVQKIQSLNDIRSTRLHIGQILRIPGRQKAPAPATRDYKTYLVKSGDSPFRIAQSHNMPLDRFLRINSLTPRSRIYPGQKLQVE